MWARVRNYVCSAILRIYEYVSNIQNENVCDYEYFMQSQPLFACEHLVIFKYCDGISETIGVLFAIKIIASNAEYSDRENNTNIVMQRIHSNNSTEKLELQNRAPYE